MGALEEGDGAFARYDAELVGVGLGEEVAEGAFFFGREVEGGLICGEVLVDLLVPRCLWVGEGVLGSLVESDMVPSRA